MVAILVYFGFITIKKRKDQATTTTINPIIFYAKVFVVAVISTISGTGTGKILIPLLRGYGLERSCAIKNAKKIAIFNCAIITCANLIIDKNVQMPHCVGSIYIAGFITVLLSSIYPMYLGIKLGEKFHPQVNDTIFGSYLIFSAMSLLIFHV